MEKQFNYDLERLKQYLDCPSYYMPSGMTFQEFQLWMQSLGEQNEMVNTQL